MAVMAVSAEQWHPYRRGVLPQGTPAAQIGKSVGEIVGGLALSLFGGVGTVGGAAVTASGIGAPVGVPVIVASSALAVSGVANAAAGMQRSGELMATNA